MNSLRERASWWTTHTDMLFTKLYPSIKLQPANLQGKRALVTGANTGIGNEVAGGLAQQGAEVWLLCRNPKAAETARAELVERSGNDKVFVEIIDLSSLESVRAFDQRWALRTPEDRKVHLLCNNAGE